MQETINKWDNHFLQMALLNAKLSKDPSTKVGAIIIGEEKELISAGFNGFPRGVEDTVERLNDRETKLSIMVHAEMNAILAAAKLGIKIKKCTMYIGAISSNGDIWGGLCSNCAKHIIQTGISKIVTYNFSSVPERWLKDLNYSKEILKESNIQYVEF